MRVVGSRRGVLFVVRLYLRRVTFIRTRQRLFDPFFKTLFVSIPFEFSSFAFFVIMAYGGESQNVFEVKFIFGCFVMDDIFVDLRNNSILPFIVYLGPLGFGLIARPTPVHINQHKDIQTVGHVFD
jgi:hypothetical protein